MRKQVRLIVVEDSETFVRGLKAVLITEGGFDIVAVTDNVETAIHQTKLHKPDVILVDMRIKHGPGTTKTEYRYGIELIERLRVHAPDTAIVVLTFSDDKRWMTQALREGVAAYLNKDLRASRIVDSLRVAAAGHMALTLEQFEILRGGNQRFITELTAREMDVLALLAEWMSTEQIAEKLRIAEKTVYKHSERIFSKLHVNSRAEAVRIARKRGIIS